MLFMDALPLSRNPTLIQGFPMQPDTPCVREIRLHLLKMIARRTVDPTSRIYDYHEVYGPRLKPRQFWTKRTKRWIGQHHRIIARKGKRLKVPKQTMSMGSGFVSSEFPVSIRPKIDNKQVILAVACMDCMENGIPECNAAQTERLTAKPPTYIQCRQHQTAPKCRCRSLADRNYDAVMSRGEVGDGDGLTIPAEMKIGDCN
ncbi:hypothetical protein NA56DRAFT_704835 [Hyaloscypha hepaticicola]|uniref:Uncharacterized protein n=1 Tax=Hyaloscypha hepaticicola TaxID=2082293 RepID=A0A2J6Q176_9HELO|nr:hypothetical protein NA56DRAFT_704835 [Hyaloscypha hepaticicola]